MVNNKGVVKSDFKQTYEFSNESVPMSESISRSLSKVAPSVKVSYGNCMNDEKYEGKHGLVNKGIPLMVATGCVIFSGGTGFLAGGGGLTSVEISLSSGASGLADLSTQLMTKGFDIRQVNWTSVAASTIFKNPYTQAAVGTYGEYTLERKFEGSIFGDKTLKQANNDIIWGTFGNVLGGKGSEMSKDLFKGDGKLVNFFGEYLGEIQGEVMGSCSEATKPKEKTN